MAAIAALPAMHRRFVAAGIAPVYLVDHPAATDPRAVAMLGEALGDAGVAIGAQLHPWVNPPHVAGTSGDLASFAGNLPPALEAAKLDALVAAIAGSFGVRPLIYRAGRYGLGPRTLALLAERGFRIDSSMRARHDYRAQGGAGFDGVSNAAFAVAPGLIELPLTTVMRGWLRRRGAVLHPIARRIPRGPGLLARTGALSRVPLTPEGVSAAEAVAAIATAYEDGERLLTLSFHSPSLAPGNTPYVRDAADLAVFHHWWDAVLPALSAQGFAPASLAEVIAAADDACQRDLPSASAGPAHVGL